MPFSPVQRQRKFSALFGTTSVRSVISMRPAGLPSMPTSKNTTGFDAMTSLFMDAVQPWKIYKKIEDISDFYLKFWAKYNIFAFTMTFWWMAAGFAF